MKRMLLFLFIFNLIFFIDAADKHKAGDASRKSNIPTIQRYPYVRNAQFNPADSTTYYISNNALAPFSTQELQHIYYVPAGIVTRMCVAREVKGLLGAGASGSVVITIRKNGVQQAMTINQDWDTAPIVLQCTTDGAFTTVIDDAISIDIAAPVWTTTNPTNVTVAAYFDLRLVQ